MDVFHAMHASFEDLIRTPLFGITLTVAAYLVPFVSGVSSGAVHC